MIQINNIEALKDFDTTVAYRAQDLGLEPGEWDFVTCNGDLQIYEDYEEMAADAMDNTKSPIKLLGKEYKPSDIAREVDPAGWQAFVELGITFAIANDLIRKIV
ncbi:MAG: hypothetical protein HXN12_00010 [Porphyromonadaceae bacterium]|nr:hypothetical protein [Porphyromonadaceae bacterium]